VVSFTLRQVTSIEDTVYRVINTVTAAEGASPAVYVYKTVSQTYSHYAAAADMEIWPDSYTTAQLLGVTFYRLATLSRTWPTVRERNADLTESVRRLQALADELNAQQGTLVLDRTTVVVGA